MDPLDDAELELAQSLIDDLTAGSYKVEQIYGEIWPAVPNGTIFGKRFKAAVTEKRLTGIVWKDRTEQNHQLYLIG